MEIETMRSLLVAAIFVLISVDPAQSDSRQSPIGTKQMRVKKSVVEKIRALPRILGNQGTKRNVIGNFGHPDRIGRAANGDEIWTYDDFGLIIFNNGKVGGIIEWDKLRLRHVIVDENGEY